MGPGPANVNRRVLAAMTAPILGHLDPDFLRAMDDVKEMLRLAFRTSNNLTIPISGTGTAGMEAAYCNMVERGDHVVIAVNGYFGARMVDVANRCGAEVHAVNFPWGKPVGPDLSAVEDELKKHPKVKAVGMVHAETSTGILSPVPEMARLAHSYDAVLIADAVTSLGGEDLKVDEWDVDVCYSGSQKCLGAPPGLSPITVGPRADKIMKARKTPVQSFYLNLGDLESYWTQEARTYHHTAPISMIYSLREALRMVMEEGLEERIGRHAKNAAALRAGLEALGLGLFAEPSHRLNPLTTVWVPDEVNEREVRGVLLQDYGIEIGGGLGEIAGKVWRIGLMGESSSEQNVFAVLSALERILPGQGYEVAIGAGVAAAQKTLPTN